MATIEVAISEGIPSLTIIGLPARASRDLHGRVERALANIDVAMPQRVTVNIAPTYIRSTGSGLTLPVCCAILAATGAIPPDALGRWALACDLGGDGSTIEPVNGLLARVEAARADGFAGVIVPAHLCAEAALVDGIEIASVATLADVVAVLLGLGYRTADVESGEDPTLPDLADVRGHAAAIRAMEIAAAGGHSLLFMGEPGTGRDLLARRLPTILPQLAGQDAMEVTRLHSIAGVRIGRGLMTTPPFRAPHYTVSAPGLVGGGSSLSMGEVTLAHGGVLYLSDASEFSSMAVNALRTATRDRKVTVARGSEAVDYPSNFLLVGSDASTTRADLSGSDIGLQHRRQRIEDLGFHLKITLDHPSNEELAADPVTTSAHARERVLAARLRHAQRSVRFEYILDVDPDADAIVSELVDAETIDHEGEAIITAIAETIADLDAKERVDEASVREAIALYLG